MRKQNPLVDKAGFSWSKSANVFRAFNSACHVRATEPILRDFLVRKEVLDLAGTQGFEMVGPVGLEPTTKGL
jgi:hypothetical protein